MIPELGQLALILALLLALLQGSLPLIGAGRGSYPLIAVARPAAAGQILFVWLAWLALIGCLLYPDFSVRYVAAHTDRGLPWYYRLTAAWGAHEGSCLLWVSILALWTGAFALFSRRKLPELFAARVLAVLGLLAAGFLSFILFTSNPFQRLFPIPLHGAGLNPLLQNPSMMIHPPLLYMGYVGFSIVFAFAIAALLGNEAAPQWVRWARPWTNAAWGFLSCGIVVGSWWAYTELGWGGWWSWDPVENASFMPWLTATALLHMQAVTEKRGSLHVWTLLLSIFTFSLAVLGTFLVRSGVLTSIHAFATDPRRGLYLLCLVLAIGGGALWLYALRPPKPTLGKAFTPVSRESMLLIGHLMFTIAAATILLGTLFPLLSDVLPIGRISVGAPYFSLLFTIFMVPVVVLLPLAPHLHWGNSAWPALQTLIKRLALSTAACTLVALYMLHGQTKAVAGVAAALWSGLGTLFYAIKHRRSLGRKGPRRGESIGMLLAHGGVAVFVAGALLSASLSIRHDVRLAPGQTTSIGAYRLRFDGVREIHEADGYLQQGRVTLSRQQQTLAILHPQKRFYHDQPMRSEPAISSDFIHDFYVALGEPVTPGHGENGWTLRIYYKPFVRWVWLGGLLMACGGFITAITRRFRAPYARSAASASINVTV